LTSRGARRGCSHGRGSTEVVGCLRILGVISSSMILVFSGKVLNVTCVKCVLSKVINSDLQAATIATSAMVFHHSSYKFYLVNQTVWLSHLVYYAQVLI
jgi:hypothetical protein